MSTKAGQFTKSYKIMWKYVKYYMIIYLFFLYREHILAFMVGQLIVANYFCKKAIDFWLGSK